MNKQTGFTLIELMIVVAIVAILAGVGMPAYQNYTKRAQFSEVIGATAAYKTGVEICLNLKDEAECDHNTNYIPDEISSAASGSVVQKITVIDGTITATSTLGTSGAEASYELNPDVTNGLISWVSTCTDGSTGYCS